MIGFIFTHIATAIGVTTGWMNPMIGLFVYYGFAIIRPTFLWHWNHWPFFGHSQYVAISTLIGWVLIGFGNWSNLRYIKLPLLGLLLYLVSGAMGTFFWAYNKQYAWHYYETQLKIGIMALVLLTVIYNPRHIRWMMWIVLISLGWLAYSLNTQYLEDTRFAFRLLDRGFGGVDNNGLAMIMVMGIPVAVFTAIFEKKWWVRCLSVFAALCMIHVILFSYSRGGQLGLIIMGATLFIFAMRYLPNKLLTCALTIFLAIATLQLAGAEVRERFFTIFADAEERDESAASRFDTWAGGWAAMKDKPLGLGPRNFNLLSQRYGLPRNKSIHNLFLQTGADYGFAGLIGLMTFFLGTMWLCHRMTNTPTAKRLYWPRYFGQAINISMFGFMVCSIFIGMESVEVPYILALIGLATVAYVRRVEAVEPSEEDILPELAEVPDPRDLRLLQAA